MFHFFVEKFVLAVLSAVLNSIYRVIEVEWLGDVCCWVESRRTQMVDEIGEGPMYIKSEFYRMDNGDVILNDDTCELVWSQYWYEDWKSYVLTDTESWLCRRCGAITNTGVCNSVATEDMILTGTCPDCHYFEARLQNLDLILFDGNLYNTFPGQLVELDAMPDGWGWKFITEMAPITGEDQVLYSVTLCLMAQDCPEWFVRSAWAEKVVWAEQVLIENGFVADTFSNEEVSASLAS